MSAILASWRDRLPNRGRGVGRSGLRKAAERSIPVLAFIVLPVVVLVPTVIVLALNLAKPVAYWDFHVFWKAGEAVLHGNSPYPPPLASVLAHENGFVYPAPAALLMVPFALLPFNISAALYAALMIASIPVALRIVGVRDYRCYGIALLAAPFSNAQQVGAISPFLLVGVALLWRYRDRAWIAASSVAALVMIKLFVWPLLLWLVFTRRFRAAIYAVGVMAIVTLGSWAVLGFAGFHDYKKILSILSHLVEGKGYSLVALGLSLGAGPTVSRALPWIIGGAALALIALRGRSPGADRWTFIVALGAAFALSPIIWLHYFVLLYIPIALVRPRLSWLWALPLALWVCRGQSIDGAGWEKARKVKDLALTPRIGSAGLIVYALFVATAVIAISARLATERREH